MEDIFQVLIILGVIGYGIYKQIGKVQAEKPVNLPPVAPSFDEEDYPEFQEYYKTLSPTPTPAPTVHSIAADKTKNRAKPQEARKSPLQEEETVNQEFDIHSAEEVRKGIIWSEILKRKY